MHLQNGNRPSCFFLSFFLKYVLKTIILSHVMYLLINESHHSFIQLGQRCSYVGKLFWRFCLTVPRHKPVVSYDNFDEYHTWQYVGFHKKYKFQSYKLFDFILTRLFRNIQGTWYTRMPMVPFLSWNHTRLIVAALFLSSAAELHDTLCNVAAFTCLFCALLIYEAVTYARVCGTWPDNWLSMRQNTQGNKFCLWMTAKNCLFIPS